MQNHTKLSFKHILLSIKLINFDYIYNNVLLKIIILDSKDLKPIFIALAVFQCTQENIDRLLLKVTMVILPKPGLTIGLQALKVKAQEYLV